MDINKIKFITKDNKFYNIRNGKNKLKYKIKNVYCPFGLENEYNNDIIKIELDNNNDNNIKFIELISNLKKKLIENFNCDENEIKDNFRIRKDKYIFNCRLKKYKNNINVNINYNNKNDYLNTIYDFKQNSFIDAEIEIDSIWDFRDNNKDNKMGYIIYLNNIEVY
tara:strand:+ start:12 stop:509 length:498 start_codon:yes stop_codon:yes gene_type:complete